MARLPLLAVALCMFVIGGLLVGRAALQGPSDPTTAAATTAQSTKSTTSGSASTTAAGADAPGDAPSLAQAVEGRAAELAKLAKKAQRLSVKRKTARPVAEFTFAQFNVQGATHRGNIGLRTALARDLLNKYGAQVAALQEFTGSQQRIFMSITGGAWGCYPCQSGPKSLDGENSVVWRKDRFDAINLDTRPYPYFHGAIRNMPRVLLRDKKTGAQFYVTSYHNPANVHGNAAGFRNTAVTRQVADANAVVKETKLPLIVSGDMNDRATYFCKMAGGTGMHAADGSTYQGGCRVARSPWIDWIMGTPDVEFSGYLRDDGSAADRSSDHPIVITKVKVTGRAGDGIDANNSADGTPSATPSDGSSPSADATP
ncbi:MAG: hypothetical protein JWO46_211 [Nocardioidaceae bacterium]|nr:hypothetical protein [Nocardioidaceae bacterium]